MFGKKRKNEKDAKEKEVQNGSAENHCRVCGQNKWRYVVISEPVDRSYLFSRAMHDVEFRVCECGYAERTDALNRRKFLW